MQHNPRNLLFVSHANPEDNHFAQWISLQLAKEGYRVWCDLTRLLGGEDFWFDIEEAIRSQAGKLIYVLSRSSNVKAGPLKELHLGQSVARTHDLRDFVIPLLVDDLPHSDINIRLAPINAINFGEGWAQGLRSLVQKLDRDCVPKDERFSPESVAVWWRTAREADHKVVRITEEYLSNWFAIRQLPQSIYFHTTTRTLDPSLTSSTSLYPVRRHGRHLISFASADDLLGSIRIGAPIFDSQMVSTPQFLNGIRRPTMIGGRESHNIIVALLRQGWDQLIESRGMSKFYLGKRYIVGFLKDGHINGNRVSIPKEFGGSRNRGIVGYRSRRDSEGVTWQRFWHFAIGCRPTVRPYVGYKLIPHVLFSDDGEKIWADSNRQHRARRSESRNWWNAEWRDRTLGMVHWLAEGNPYIKIPLGSEASVHVNARPLSFVSPVSYGDPEPERRVAHDAVDSVVAESAGKVRE